MQIEAGKEEAVTGFTFFSSKVTADGDCSHEIKRHLLLGRKAMTNPDNTLKSRDISLLAEVHISQSYGFSSSHVRMWELDYKESWVPKNWCFSAVVWEKILESPLDWKEIKLLLLLLLSHFSHVRLCATPQMAAHQTPPFLGFSRQEHWSGLPLPSPMHETEKWKVKVKSLSHVRLFATPWTAA